MRCVFRKSDGIYCDSEESHPPGVSDSTLVAGPNVLVRFGGVASDYTIVETDDSAPCLCRLVDGHPKRDAAKEAALAVEVQAEQAQIDRFVAIKAKAAEGTATHAELCELVANL